MDKIIDNLIKEMSNIVNKHNNIKNEIIQLTKESDLIEFKINEKLNELHIVEKEYVRIISEIEQNDGI
jgi:hypothetical protein